MSNPEERKEIDVNELMRRLSPPPAEKQPVLEWRCLNCESVIRARLRPAKCPICGYKDEHDERNA